MHLEPPYCEVPVSSSKCLPCMFVEGKPCPVRAHGRGEGCIRKSAVEQALKSAARAEGRPGGCLSGTVGMFLDSSFLFFNFIIIF